MFHDMAICTVTTYIRVVIPENVFDEEAIKKKRHSSRAILPRHRATCMPYPRTFWMIGGLVFKTKHAVVSPT